MDKASLIDKHYSSNRDSYHRRAKSRSTFGQSFVSDRRDSDSWLGRLVGGRYKVGEVLGRGGMGVVYKVKHQYMDKVAAMKVLHSELAQREDVVARFRLEAKAVSRLEHPNTVQVFDFGEMDGALYLVMEYVRGQDLGALVDRDGPMSFMTLAPLLGQLCGSLEEAHARGVVHRDLKPENILVSRTHSGKDFIKVLDFGLAKLTGREEKASVTSAGSIVGTPYYMSPEQIRAEEEVDQRSDIYSLGALLYFLVTADTPFNAKTPVGVLTKHITEELEPAGIRYPALKLPQKLDSIIVRCMKKEPQNRYQSVRHLLEDIEELFTQLTSNISDTHRPTASWFSGPERGFATAASVLVGEVDHGMDANMRLCREDLDVFEKSNERKRRLRIIVIPLLLLSLLVLAGYLLMFSPEKTQQAESEPNNVLSKATLVSAKQGIMGHIGKRMNKSTPDVDFFRFEHTSKEQEVINIVVKPPKNIDISIGLYNKSGKLLKQVNEFGLGETETLRRWRVKGASVVSVRGVLDKKTENLPTENISDKYRMKTTFKPLDSRLESEPNNNKTDANLIAPGTPITGYLDSQGDVDVYKVKKGGNFNILFSGTPDAPLEWRIEGENKWRKSLRITKQVKAGVSISIRRKDSKSSLSPALVSTPYTLDLSQAPF